MAEEATQNENGVLAIIFKHNLWANEKLFAACQNLTAEQLNQETPGTYGCIHMTMAHIVRAEERYLHFLDQYQSGYAERASEQTAVAELMVRIKQCDEALLRVAMNTADDDTVIIDDEEGEVLPAKAILLQALHHAAEHRTQINTILGQMGIEPPDISGWNYYDEVIVPEAGED